MFTFVNTKYIFQHIHYSQFFYIFSSFDFLYGLFQILTLSCLNPSHHDDKSLNGSSQPLLYQFLPVYYQSTSSQLSVYFQSTSSLLPVYFQFSSRLQPTSKPFKVLKTSLLHLHGQDLTQETLHSFLYDYKH